MEQLMFDLIFAAVIALALCIWRAKALWLACLSFGVLVGIVVANHAH